MRSVARHLNYVGRRGQLELETDDGEHVQGRHAGQGLVEDWDLDLDRDRRDSRLTAGKGRAPKLVHKIMLSMPPGTPGKGVLDAARNFAREQFALTHRYALVLHTDEPHPHVHLVVKAVSEKSERLNIRKVTLRFWRQEFARQLRRQGIPANATECAVRGEIRTHKRDGIYRATLRGESTHTPSRIEAITRELIKGNLLGEPGRAKLVETRKEVKMGWFAASEALLRQGQPELAAEARRFAEQIGPPYSDRERVAAELLNRTRHPTR